MAVTINASTSAGLVNTADTSGVLALQTAGTTAVTVDASQNVTLAGTLTTSSRGIAKASLPTGSVLQVVSTTKTDTFSTSSLITASGGSLTATGANVTGLSASITPSSATSKILVTVNIGGTNGTSGAAQAILLLLRGSTVIGAGTGSAGRPGINARGYYNDTNTAVPVSFSFLDSPSTTSSTTYQVNLGTDASGQAVYLNRTPNDADSIICPRFSSTITVMEIAA
jgi:hypothetical protein